MVVPLNFKLWGLNHVVITKIIWIIPAEHRYGREEMLALYPIGLVQDTPTSSSALLLDEDILEAMETTSLLVPDRRALPPLNLMGAVSEEEQRAWSRGANSDTSLR